MRRTNKNTVVKLLLTAALAAIIMVSAFGCGSNNNGGGGGLSLGGSNKTQEDIIVLYTADVHCGLEAGIGYAGVAAYKKSMKAKTSNVALVDCGDAIQGETIGAVSKGSYIVDVMNKVGYDFFVMGNHEFDYGLDNTGELIGELNAKTLACNITYTGREGNKLSGLKDYVIKQYGNVKVAFVGVTTPASIASATPGNFMEGGEFVYDFCGGNDNTRLFNKVQETVDEARAEGADYVIAITHLGRDESKYGMYCSNNLATGTSGIDAIIDGAAHSEYSVKMTNKADKSVILTSAGTKLSGIGCLTITASGRMKAEIKKPTAKDEETKTYIDGIKAQFDEKVNDVVAYADDDLIAKTVASSSSGEVLNWIVRQKETMIGDLCADAFRTITGADVAMVNGGGVRSNITRGDVTYKNVIDVLSFGNEICVSRVSGQNILDALEIACRSLGTDPWFGGFQQVSGLRFTVDTTIPSPVNVDTNDMYVGMDQNAERRVKDVYVEGENGVYESIDPEKMYTLASTDFLLKNSGDGITVFVNCELLSNSGRTDYDTLLQYIIVDLEGEISADKIPGDRITIIKE